MEVVVCILFLGLVLWGRDKEVLVFDFFDIGENNLEGIGEGYKYM